MRASPPRARLGRAWVWGTALAFGLGLGAAFAIGFTPPARERGRSLSRYGFEAAAALIEQKRRAERQPLDEATAGHWVRELVRAFQLLDGAAGASPLPSEPPNVEELDEWLIALRRGQLGAGLQWLPLPLSKEESVW